MRAGHVFLNVPFDRQYEPLFIALVAGCVGLGLTPRSVLEIRTTTDRIRRIWRLIRTCKFSIHDLSRVQLASSGMRVPRFNMPFEAGLAVALGLGVNHQWRVFEARPYRLNQSLSDLNGFEPFIHRGTPAGVLEALVDAFVHIPVDPAHLTKLFRILLVYRQTSMGSRFFEPRPFSVLVRTAVQTRRKLMA